MESTISRKICHNVSMVCYPCSFHCFWNEPAHCPTPRILSFWRNEINSGSWQVPEVIMSFSQLPHLCRGKDLHGLGLPSDSLPEPSYGILRFRGHLPTKTTNCWIHLPWQYSHSTFQWWKWKLRWSILLSHIFTYKKTKVKKKEIKWLTPDYLE